jgi:hypothetical protein
MVIILANNRDISHPRIQFHRFPLSTHPILPTTAELCSPHSKSPLKTRHVFNNNISNSNNHSIHSNSITKLQLTMLLHQLQSLPVHRAVQ